MRAVLHQVRISPKKANLIAGMVRKRTAAEGLELLKYMPKKGARIIYKVLASAVANAESNFGQDKKDLVISSVFVTSGPIYKRGQSHSKGRVTPLFKRTSHITIELEAGAVEEDAKEESETKKTEKK